MQFHSYADDVQLYIFADPRQADSMAQALHSLSACMEDIVRLMKVHVIELGRTLPPDLYHEGRTTIRVVGWTLAVCLLN